MNMQSFSVIIVLTKSLEYRNCFLITILRNVGDLFKAHGCLSSCLNFYLNQGLESYQPGCLYLEKCVITFFII